MLTLTREFIMTIRKASEAEYRGQLTGMGVPKKKVDDLAAGFADGMTAFLHHLIAAELVDIEAEPPKENRG